MIDIVILKKEEVLAQRKIEVEIALKMPDGLILIQKRMTEVQLLDFIKGIDSRIKMTSIPSKKVIFKRRTIAVRKI